MRVYDFTKMSPEQVIQARQELCGQQQRNSDLSKLDPNEIMRRNLRNPTVIEIANCKKKS